MKVENKKREEEEEEDKKRLAWQLVEDDFPQKHQEEKSDAGAYPGGARSRAAPTIMSSFSGLYLPRGAQVVKLGRPFSRSTRGARHFIMIISRLQTLVRVHVTHASWNSRRVLASQPTRKMARRAVEKSRPGDQRERRAARDSSSGWKSGSGHL